MAIFFLTPQQRQLRAENTQEEEKDIGKKMRWEEGDLTQRYVF